MAINTNPTRKRGIGVNGNRPSLTLWVNVFRRDALMAKSDRRAAPAKESSLPDVPTSRYVLFFAIAILGAAADLVTKEWMFQWRGMPRQANEWWLIDGYVGIETSLNLGALFGMGRGYSWAFAALSIAAGIGIFFWLFVFRAARDRLLTVALGCVMGGILGNLYDRLGLYHYPWLQGEYEYAVRDWILFRYGQHTWPNFNIADSLLVCGAAVLVWHAVWYREEKRAETGQEAGDRGQDAKMR